MTTTTKTKWGIDPTHSEIEFKVKHLMITNVKGSFKEFRSTVYTHGNDFLTSDIEIVFNAASIDTGVADRDAHLRSADFFDVENFNQIRFVGKKLDRKDDESYTLFGELTIKGITKPVALDVVFDGVMKDPWGNEKAGFSVNGKFNRKEWNLNWNAALEAGGVLVGEEVKINGEVQLIKQE